MSLKITHSISCRHDLSQVKAAFEHQTKFNYVKRVFVTFNTEEGQRAALQHFCTGWWQRLKGGRNVNASRAETVFGGRVLILDEACEPSEVIWENLRYRFHRRLLR